MKTLKFMAVCVISITLSACGGGGGGGTSGGGVNPTPTPAANSVLVNIGNVSTIPLGHGGGSTTAVVSNNYPNELVLTSATYTIYGSSGAQAPVNAMVSGGAVDTSLCTRIQAKGSCSLGISVPQNASNQGQYLVTLNYLNAALGKTVSTSQLISYSSAVPINSNGVQVSTNNNTLFNAPDATTTYSTPFVLTQAVSTITAVSQYNNPAVAPTISCNGSAPYAAGTVCTLFVRISQTGSAKVVSGNVTVSTNGIGALQVKSKLLSIKGVTGYLFNVPVTVVQNNTGNLITSAINLIVNPANGLAGNAQSVTLFNNGSGSITGITVNGNTPTAIGSNTCTGTLIAGSACSFTVNGTVTTNTQAAVVVNYTSNGTNNAVAFNVSYIAAAASPGLTLTPSGNLNNSLESVANTITVTVANTSSTTTLSNITFTGASLLPTSTTYSGSTCNTTGSQSLPPLQSCVLNVNYTPPAPTAGGTFTINATANYSAPDGSIGSISSGTTAISYSAIIGNSLVYISPNYVAYAIKADGVDSVTQTFAIINVGPNPTTVTGITLASPSVTGYTNLGTGTCSFPQALTATGSAGESCTVVAKFGPVSTTQSNTQSTMSAVYYTAGVTTANAYSYLSFTSSTAALVSILSMTESGNTAGTGLTGSPFNFINSPESAPIQFTITYQNTGNESALNFNVALNTLPTAYYKTGGTCGTGSSTSTLAASGGTCTAIFKAESTGLYNSYNLNAPIPFQLPGYSYTDSNGLSTNSAPTLAPFTGNTVFVTPLALATVSQSAASWTTATAGGSNTLTFTSSGGTPAGTTVIIQNQSLFGGLTFATGSGTGATAGTCVIAALNGSCTIGVTNIAFYPLGTINFFYIVAPSTASTTGIIQSGSITYTN